MSNKFEKIGLVGVDSAQLMICDPCYIDSEWKFHDMEDIRQYKYKPTGKIYEFRKDFKNYNDVLLKNKTVNELIKEKKLIQVNKRKETGEFSYDGCCSATMNKHSFGQLNYKRGHKGVAVAFSSGFGDGTYPVYARKDKDGNVIEVKILMS